ncbi:Clp protease N-terminal domain-containing protein [Raineyella sp. W15-4]|uniref:Clp protease N-terminal domain-containing protein n=1 Tax=Raineyella sp. W15-4 TaxID=3081651 RepID=UPI002952A7C4|nr:Clp protease N-terminal domain-containing protein [Raineyella sp. W15-4]WOQ15810.1 Clp protease N-terminal domain-containing protein [Raineyella sp. W15-4]
MLRSGGLDADALASLGVDLEQVRWQADAVFGPGALDRAGRTRAGQPRFDRRAKKALELALREAFRLKDRSIESRHLCLGLLRADGSGQALLEKSGVDPATLRPRSRPRAPRHRPPDVSCHPPDCRSEDVGAQLSSGREDVCVVGRAAERMSG